MNQKDIKNETLRNYPFLRDMYKDSYFPVALVDKGKAILIELCIQIEHKQPKTSAELYELTHAATDKFNDLENEFWENESEIETAAAGNIAADFHFIAETYGYYVDVEELVANREW